MIPKSQRDESVYAIPFARGSGIHVPRYDFGASQIEISVKM